MRRFIALVFLLGATSSFAGPVSGIQAAYQAAVATWTDPGASQSFSWSIEGGNSCILHRRGQNGNIDSGFYTITPWPVAPADAHYLTGADNYASLGFPAVPTADSNLAASHATGLSLGLSGNDLIKWDSINSERFAASGAPAPTYSSGDTVTMSTTPGGAPYAQVLNAAGNMLSTYTGSTNPATNAYTSALNSGFGLGLRGDSLQNWGNVWNTKYASTGETVPAYPQGTTVSQGADSSGRGYFAVNQPSGSLTGTQILPINGVDGGSGATSTITTGTSSVSYSGGGTSSTSGGGVIATGTTQVAITSGTNATNVNVTTPQVSVSPTTVNVAAPVVNVTTPPVTVNVAPASNDFSSLLAGMAAKVKEGVKGAMQDVTGYDGSNVNTAISQAADTSAQVAAVGTCTDSMSSGPLGGSWAMQYHGMGQTPKIQVLDVSIGRGIGIKADLDSNLSFSPLTSSLMEWARVCLRSVCVFVMLWQWCRYVSQLVI